MFLTFNILHVLLVSTLTNCWSAVIKVGDCEPFSARASERGTFQRCKLCIVVIFI